MLRYEENILRRLTDGTIDNITETIFKAAANKQTERSGSSTYEDVEDVLKRDVNCGAAENAISSRLDSFTESQGFE